MPDWILSGLLTACSDGVDLVNMSITGYLDPSDPTDAQTYLLFNDVVQYCRARAGRRSLRARHACGRPRPARLLLELRLPRRPRRSRRRAALQPPRLGRRRRQHPLRWLGLARRAGRERRYLPRPAPVLALQLRLLQGRRSRVRLAPGNVHVGAKRAWRCRAGALGEAGASA